jgi:polyphosphate kinase
MLESMPGFLELNDKSIYLACKLSKKDKSIPRKFALVSVPARRLLSFCYFLPPGNRSTISFYWKTLSDFACPIFSRFSDTMNFQSAIIKVTKE